MEGNVQFETIQAEEMKFGKNNFLEIARKKAITQEGENEFLAISRGFFLPDGTKKFKKSLAIPDEKGMVEFIGKKLVEFCKESEASSAQKAEAEKPAEKPAEAAAEQTEESAA